MPFNFYFKIIYVHDSDIINDNICIYQRKYNMLHKEILKIQHVSGYIKKFIW